MLECLINGEISTLLNASSRGLCFGDGVLESIPVHNGRPRRWQTHMDRLGAGCERLGLVMPPQAILLREAQTVSVGLANTVVQIIVIRDGQCTDYAAGEDFSCTRVVSAHPYPDGLLERAREGVRARICDLRLAIQPALGGIKHLNRLEQVLASTEMRDEAADEGLLLDSEGHVISSISANIFIVMGDRLLTPRLDRCGVRGVLRSHILKDFASRCEQRRVQEDLLQEAHEVFLCDCIRGIAPVTAIDDYQYSIGPVTRELQTWLLEGSRSV